jgi:hypothetical protein
MIFLIIFRPLLLIIERGDQDSPMGAGQQRLVGNNQAKGAASRSPLAAPIDTGTFKLFFSRVLAAFLMRLFRVAVCRLRMAMSGCRVLMARGMVAFPVML